MAEEKVLTEEEEYWLTESKRVILESKDLAQDIILAVKEGTVLDCGSVYPAVDIDDVKGMLYQVLPDPNDYPDDKLKAIIFVIKN